ncbi:MAG TPA: molecular chaperone HtpG [Gemmataceae bacterium]|jgi:molecular chaperone HtpG|nr:molecular chaperone HtpG [Gemmataceae bacterium]
MPDTLEFKAELKQLLHLITHSLYSHPEIFLRELISNASDAINKIKFDSLANEGMLENNKDWKIKIIADKQAGTLTVSDNGVGMSREEIVENLGTIAKSGTRAFVEMLKSQQAQQRPELIGQFGVGFYSSFMVADKVTVLSRPAGDPKDGVRWESDGQGQFTVEPAEKATRGTDVTLHLKPECKDYLEPFTLRSIVRMFSDFIEHPIVMDVEKEDDNKNKTVTEETLNSRKAIWLRNKSEVTSEEYAEFYKLISHDEEPPAKVIHYTAEGAREFRVLMFIPAHKPLELEWGEPKSGLRLYVQRVLIMERCEQVLPMYLRFVRGVVDASDLPLNVSREILQQDPQLEVIRKNVVRNVLQGLEAMKTTEYEKYVKFYQGLGTVLKEGTQDWNNREKVADLLLFESMQTSKGEYTTLAKYVESMPPEQNEIYYLIGESREEIEHSPYLESFRAKGIDVLLLTDPIDEFAIPNLGQYKGKHLRAVDRGDLEEKKEEKSEETASFQGLLVFLKEKLPEVRDVRLSKRLTESAAVLVADVGAVTAHFERLMQRFGREAGDEAGKRVLEFNPSHAAVLAMRDLYAKNPSDPRIENYGRLLYEQAVLAEGSKLKDPAAFAKRINELLVKDAKA